ncbi:MAG: hypothetical protein U9Q24_03555 [Candidatus Ratteibacteria bacterium]|nr:hypothetical protein [Candidatus Ratteibacteria bacterium]
MPFLPRKVLIRLKLNSYCRIARIVLLLLFFSPSLRAETDTLPQPFYVYSDKDSPGNFFYPSGWMGNVECIEFDDNWVIKPHSGSSCIRLTYNPSNAGLKWAGIYWQNPPNNWGFKEGSLDLTGARRLTFWARGEKGGEVIEKFRIGGIIGRYPDSTMASLSPVVLTKDWAKYIIDLTDKDLAYISGGFCWVVKSEDNPDGLIFYLDDIRYE